MKKTTAYMVKKGFGSDFRKALKEGDTKKINTFIKTGIVIPMEVGCCKE